jgi:hypothetical protein
MGMEAFPRRLVNLALDPAQDLFLCIETCNPHGRYVEGQFPPNEKVNNKYSIRIPDCSFVHVRPRRELRTRTQA